jgi:hypothetical protein
VIEAIKTYCVPFARNGALPNAYPGDDAFFANLEAQKVGLGNSMFLCTAAGKVVPGSNDRDFWKWLFNWKKLPANDRQSGALGLEDRGKIKASSRHPEPPTGALILNTYMRALDRDSSGELRAPARLSLGVSKTIITAEPNRDFLWLTETEWKALIPKEPRKGQTYPVPVQICDRIFRFHLVDGACCLPSFWQRHHVRGGTLDMIVEGIDVRETRLSVHGWAKLGAKEPYLDFDLDGALIFDSIAKTFTRFDMVAVSRSPCHKDVATKREMWLGIAFELAGPGAAMGRRVPYRIWYDDAGYKEYLGP